MRRYKKIPPEHVGNINNSFLDVAQFDQISILRTFPSHHFKQLLLGLLEAILYAVMHLPDAHCWCSPLFHSPERRTECPVCAIQTQAYLD